MKLFRWTICLIYIFTNIYCSLISNNALTIFNPFLYLTGSFCLNVASNQFINFFFVWSPNTTTAFSTMNQLSPIGLYSKGFTLLLSTRLYSLIIRAQLEYGLAITKITSFLVTQIEDAQNACLCRTFGSSPWSSTKVVFHMTKPSTMQERSYIIQSQVLLHFLTLPENALLPCLLPYIHSSSSRIQWYMLFKSPVWKRRKTLEPLDRRWLRAMQLQFRQDNYDRAACSSILLFPLSLNNLFRPHPLVTYDQHWSQCIRWCLGCLPRVALSPVPSTRKPRSLQVVLTWTLRWPTICTILYEPDHLQHAKVPLVPPPQLE